MNVGDLIKVLEGMPKDMYVAFERMDDNYDWELSYINEVRITTLPDTHGERIVKLGYAMHDTVKMVEGV